MEDTKEARKEKKERKKREKEAEWARKEKEVEDYFTIKPVPPQVKGVAPSLESPPVPHHHSRCLGLAVGETASLTAGKEFLNFSAPPIEALRRRLQALSPGLSRASVNDILMEHPSKRLLMAYVGSFASREDLMIDLEVR